MTGLQRLPDWPERLAAFVEQRRHVPFAWGANDCATFAADAVLAITGRDPMQRLRGRWLDEPQALGVLAGLGGLAWAAKACLGRPLLATAGAPRGSVVLARMLGRPVMGLALADWWAAPGAHGLEFRPCSEVRLVWVV